MLYTYVPPFFTFSMFNEMFWTLYYLIPWMPFPKSHAYTSVVLLILLSMKANLLFSYTVIVYNVYNGIGLTHKFADRVIRLPWSILSIWRAGVFLFAIGSRSRCMVTMVSANSMTGSLCRWIAVAFIRGFHVHSISFLILFPLFMTIFPYLFIFL